MSRGIWLCPWLLALCVQGSTLAGEKVDQSLKALDADGAEAQSQAIYKIRLAYRTNKLSRAQESEATRQAWRLVYEGEGDFARSRAALFVTWLALEERSHEAWKLLRELAESENPEVVGFAALHVPSYARLPQPGQIPEAQELVPALRKQLVDRPQHLYQARAAAGLVCLEVDPAAALSSLRAALESDDRDLRVETIGLIQASARFLKSAQVLAQAEALYRCFLANKERCELTANLSLTAIGRLGPATKSLRHKLIRHLPEWTNVYGALGGMGPGAEDVAHHLLEGWDPNERNGLIRSALTEIVPNHPQVRPFVDRHVGSSTWGRATLQLENGYEKIRERYEFYLKPTPANHAPASAYRCKIVLSLSEIRTQGTLQLYQRVVAEDRSSNVRGAVCRALASWGSQPKVSSRGGNADPLPDDLRPADSKDALALVRDVFENDAAARPFAALALARLAGKSSLEDLIKALGEGGLGVGRIAEAIGLLGPDAASAVPALRALRGQDKALDRELRIAISRILGLDKDPE